MRMDAWKEAKSALARKSKLSIALFIVLTWAVVSVAVRRVQDGGAETGRLREKAATADSAHSPKAQADALETAQAGCSGGGSDSCLQAGELFAQGSGPAKNLEQARALFEKACSLRSAQGCFRLGEVYRDGVGVAADLGRALGLFDQACADGIMLACVRAGAMHMQGKGVPLSEPRAVPYYQRACEELKDAGSCGVLGDIYRRGQGVKRDVRRAATLFQTSCDMGAALGCLFLGHAYAGGSGVKRNYQTATSLFKRACDQDDAAGCFRLGEILAQGKGAKPDLAAAKAAYEKACRLEKDGRGCRALAAVTRESDRRDAIDAQALYSGYHENAVAADEAVKGRRFVVRGIVQAVVNDDGYPVVQLRSPNRFLPVLAYVSLDEKVSTVAALTKRQEVFMSCEGSGLVMGSPVLKECAFR